MTLTPTEQLDAGAAEKLAVHLGLTARELAHACAALGRTPGKAELAMFAGMWSEHCSYKSTKHWLATLPRTSPRVLAGPGSHAGTVDVGHGWAVAFKIESHNHPSAVEPYQGAATGVGGILRDVIAQGARPCAVLDSLCFGLPKSDKARHLIDGVVNGIAGYGNAIGIPNVGGRTVYDSRYEGNPLVNAMAVGLLRADEMRTAAAAGAGNAVVYVGATTGRDGILGAAFASEELAPDTVEDRPHVQVGDPFTGKKLMEAVLGFGPAQGLIAAQDLGACGITCAVTEMAAAGGVGMEIDLDQVPLRESDMTPHEILLSESQERFMLVVRAGGEEAALAHFRAHGLHAAVIGRVSAGERLRVRRRAELVADVPAKLVAGGAPPTEWPLANDLARPTPYRPFTEPADLGHVLCDLLAAPGIASKEPVTAHYDQTVGNRTARGPEQAAAAVMKLPDTTAGFALTVTSRGDLCGVDPYQGARASLAEACRRLAACGAELVAITDGLNCGSPQDPLENKRLSEVIRGLKDGLTELNIPVTGGNVSLYNESPHGAIPPTPMVGALGLVADVRRVPSQGLAKGDVIFLLGSLAEEPTASFYGRLATGSTAGEPPRVDLAAEKKLARLLVAEAHHLAAAKEASLGGLAVALAKLCVRGHSGAQVKLPAAKRRDWLLFGEYPAQAWVSTRPADADRFERTAKAAGVPVLRAGVAGGDTLAIAGILRVSLAEIDRAYSGQSHD